MRDRHPASEPPLPPLSRADVFALAVLAVFVLSFYWKMVFTDLILPRGDTFTYFYPYWVYRNEALRSGRLPLWNPYLFMGAPFLANSQTGVLYLPNWLLIWLDAPDAVKAAIVTHVAWAAAGMYLFARRSLRLGVLGAVTAGAVFALGGYLTAQVEHVNQVQGLAWMPWLFRLWDSAQTGKRWAILWLGLAFAMQLLAGHSQTTFISGISLGCWALWRAFKVWQEGRRNRLAPGPALARIAWPLGALALGVLLGGGLAAAQLAPTLELARLSNRSGGLPFLEAISFSLRPQLIGRALLPGYSGEPLFSEYVSYTGIAAFGLALLGLRAGWRRWRIAGLGILAVVAVLLAIGAFNPVYWAMVRYLPGFNLFRAPARWLVLLAFSAGGLAGTGLDALAQRHEQGKRQPVEALWPALPTLALVGLSFLAPIPVGRIGDATAPQPVELFIWALTLILTLALVWWTMGGLPEAHRWGVPALAALAVVELFVASRELPFNQLSAPGAWSDQRPAISTLLAASQGETPPSRFLSLSEIEFDPGDLREIRAIYGPYLTEKGLYDFIIAVKQQEILAPNLPTAWGIPSMDGFDGGVLPLRDYTRFTGLFLPPGTWNPDGRLREHLESVPDLAWLRLANVRWIITDKVADAWIGDVYYDLQFPARLTATAGQSSPPSVEAYPPHPFEATAVGIVGYLEGAEGLPEGEQVGAVAVFSVDQAMPLVQPLIAGSSLNGGTPDSREVTLVSWGSALDVERVEVSVAARFPGALVVQGISLIDERSGAFLPTTIANDHVLRLAHSGDVKIYNYRDALPRAYLVCAPERVASDEEAFARLAADPTTPVIVDAGPNQAPARPCSADDPGRAAITAYKAERVVVAAESRGEGVYLILSDAWYPGWEASVDEQPVEVLRANGLFRAVRLPEGAHEVVFTFRSRTLVAGAAISGVCAVGIAIWLAAARLGQVITGRSATAQPRS